MNCENRHIVCAACKIGETIICGARHFDSIMRTQMKAIGPTHKWTKAEQGFIDQFGVFHTRKVAMQIVKTNGQPFSISRNGGDIELFSEGIY